MIESDKPVVLIVGDSFIDENWLMSRCDIYHSYNVGREHYISDLRDTDCRVISFCGAASIWQMLNGPESRPNADAAIRSTNPAFLTNTHRLITLSAWNPTDGNLLPCLLCGEVGIHQCERSYTPYLVSGPVAPNVSDSNKIVCPRRTDGKCKYQDSFFNLVKNSDNAKKFTSTNHIIRLYEGFGGDQPCLQYRFDWQLDLAEEHKNYYILDTINEKLMGSDVQAIVIVDHGYGVVDDLLVKRLLDKFPTANWYVRSKLKGASWKDQIEKSKGNLRLVFSDEQLLEYEYGVRAWRHGPTVLGRGALEVLGDLLGLPKYLHTKIETTRPTIRADNAALLFEDDTVIAASRIKDNAEETEDAFLINISRAPGEKQPIVVGRSTVFFSSLIYWDLRNKLEGSLHKASEWALANSYEWTVKCTKAWLDKKPTELSGPFRTIIYRGHKNFFELNKKNQIDAAPNGPKYHTSWKKWNKSSEGLGIVMVDGEKQIHLWRAQGTLKDYICPGGKKRSEINNLISQLKAYKNKRAPRHPFNCLFLAEPGWGKTTLAKCLARNFEFEFLKFSIAQMSSNQDLINCLKTIVSTQNRTNARVLVFIDEIDAQIESHNGMGLLLGPIWGGSFMSEGNFYRIKPCVWVFASSMPLGTLRSEVKGRDFLSRINAPVVNLDFFAEKREDLAAEKNEEQRRILMANIVRSKEDSLPLRTELVYHGINFLNRIFGPISSIDESVLRIFYNIMPIDGIRSVEIFVSRFRDVSRGHVSINSVPDLRSSPELERHIFPLDKWDTKKNGESIKVVVNPPK